jgi:hypothetical protein
LIDAFDAEAHPALASPFSNPTSLAHFSAFAAAAHAEPPDAAWGSREPGPVRVEQVARVSDPRWTAFVSTQITSEQASVFHFDTQNFIEVWNRDARLLIGGGQSKYTPRFSTLRRTSGSRGYIPTAATITERTARRVVAMYDFDDDQVRARVEIVGDEIHVGFKVVRRGTRSETYEAGVVLFIKPGDSVRIGGEPPRPLDPEDCVQHTFVEQGESFQFRGATFLPPASASLWYPMMGWNPYARNTLGKMSGRLFWPLDDVESVLVIRV